MDFETLYRQQKGGVFQLALRLLRHPEKAMDAAQETFVKAFKAKDSFRGESKPSTWLYRIAYNTCLAYGDGKDHAGQSPDSAELFDREQAEPDGAALREELRFQVARALARLPEQDRRLLCLQMEQDLYYEDIAHILDCPVEAVRMRVCRARRRLREILSPMLEKQEGENGLRKN